MSIIIFTDGSSRGNPGPGGWAAIVWNNEKIHELGGSDPHTTNNRMELTALLQSLVFLEKREMEGNVTLYIDSQYVLSGVTVWMYGWEKNEWTTKTKEKVLNQDIWKELLVLVYRLKQKRNLIFKKVDGHSGVLGNERVDLLATQFADKERVLLFTGATEMYEKLIGGTLADLRPSHQKKNKKSSSQKAYSYVSLVEKKVYVDSNWEDCKKRVSGKKGVQYKKVFSKEEEEALVKIFKGK